MKSFLTDKPGPPENVRATKVTENSADIKWDEPADNGGCDITKYAVELRETSGRSWTSAGKTDDLEMTLKNLTEKKTYMARVAAINEIGQGPFAEIDNAFTPKSEHGASASKHDVQHMILLI